jgi:hypothetical protein
MRAKARTTWNVRPMPRRQTRFGLSLVIGSPAKVIVPLPGARKPFVTLNSVVLPAPLGPIMPWSPPSGTARSIWSSARSPPNEMPTPFNTSKSAPAVVCGCGKATTGAAAMVADGAGRLSRLMRSSTRQ